MRVSDALQNTPAQRCMYFFNISICIYAAASTTRASNRLAGNTACLRGSGLLFLPMYCYSHACRCRCVHRACIEQFDTRNGSSTLPTDMSAWKARSGVDRSVDEKQTRPIHKPCNTEVDGHIKINAFARC